MGVFDPIRFDGDWADNEKKSVSDTIMVNCPYIGEPAYNRWTFYKYSDGHFYALRQTWDLGGMDATDFSDLISKLEDYYRF